MIQIRRTDSSNVDFIALVKLLDADLAIRDGNEHDFYHQFNKIDALRYVVLAYDGEQAVGCGAIKAINDSDAEVKRMYTLPEARGRGIASLVLAALELWAKELHFNSCILETGKKQPEAIALYQKNKYEQIPNYGQYEGIENSVCFRKKLHT